MKSFEDHRTQLEAEFSSLHGTDLVRKLVDTLAHQARRIDALESSVQLLNAYQEGRDLLLNIQEPVSATEIEMASSFELSAMEHLPRSSGFHGIEFDNAGNPFRWAGESGLLTFTCYIDRGRPNTVTLDLINSVEPANYEHLAFFDDDAERQVTLEKTTPAGRRVTSVLPSRDQATGPTTLTFRFPHFRRLSEDDRRTAAVAFHSLLVTGEEAA
ncbi:hypothetical protein [Marinibacterium sp. SX1]|uniref:hypothetical protein n=1 Tax=Marinibacterium sp. SX1 TaxID=3388424 RepID=UPI003D16A821